MAGIAKVVVEIALDREFDYLVPPAIRESVLLGSRVRVPFGTRETTGYVVGFAERSDMPKLKEIAAVIGEKPILDERILKLARWMGEYYLAPVETAVRAVLPGAVRRKGARHKARLFACPVSSRADSALSPEWRRKHPKPAAALDALRPTDGMFLADLAAMIPPITVAAVRALEKQGWVTVEPRAVARDPLANRRVLPTLPLALMSEQAEALAKVKQAIDTFDPPVVLLYGVTGSGKTEVYLQAIQHAREQGKGAIVLVPEIALTPQTVERFQGRFGDTIAVLHSNLSDGERHDEWYRIHAGKAQIVIGARSAVFAPVKNLGLIVVDEEHEPTYKQDEVPRYHARDVAVMRGRIERCAVLLGSATPSLESYRNTQSGKYAFCVLPRRVDNQKMPVMRVLDMRQEAERTGRVNILSQDLVEAIRTRIERAEQTMLFLNRRGFATALICPKCGYVAQCRHCSISLTYHKDTDNLRCHICGSASRVPDACPTCHDRTFKFSGIGTQRVEAVVRQIFPKAQVQRMDADVTARKDSYHRILTDFRAGRIDILIGTQMIAKGLHFPNVTLIGVIHADLSLHMPDFRASERTFQLLTQVAGRAGRGEVPGLVIVQTFTPFHPAVQAARRFEMESFFNQEMESRRELRYPPFSHLVCLTIRGAPEERVRFSAEAIAGDLTSQLSSATILSGPVPAPLAKTKGMHRYQIILRTSSMRSAAETLRQVLGKRALPPRITCSVDVDAVSLM